MKSVIIGNGILGLAIALRMAERAGAKDQIVVIGKATREGSATLAAAAMLNSFAEVETGSLATPMDKYRFDLSTRAGKAWSKFAKQMGAKSLGLGTYVVNNSAADDLDDENFDAILAALKSYKEPHELVNPRDIPNYHPEQRYRATRALYVPGEGYMNPREAMTALEIALRCYKQVQFVDASATKLVKKGAKIISVTLEGGKSVAGDEFVLATGATVSNILDASKLGINMQRIFYGVGVSLEISSPEHRHKKCIRTPNRGLACGVYSVPYGGDRILIGATNFITTEPRAHGRLMSVENISRSAMEQINTHFYRADLVRVNVGWRPTSQDTYPLLGRSSIKNLAIATGTKRDGFHLAPVISQLLVEQLRGGKVEKGWEQFAPERKPIRALTRKQAVEKAVRHQISAAYQHNYTPAQGRMAEAVAEQFRAQVEAIHDQVGAKDWGIPPEMLDMYRYGHAKP